MLSHKGARTRRALADLLLGDAPHVDGALADIDAIGSWQDVVALAARWRVSSAVRTLFEARAVPPDSRSLLRRLHAMASAHATFTLHRSADVCALLEQAGISTMAVKGVAAIAQLYGSPAARLVGDFDCLVAESDAREAERTLLMAGYVSLDVPFEAHVHDIDVSPCLHNYARTYVQDGFEVDLHWRLGARPPAALMASAILARSSLASAGGVQVRVPHPVDAQLLTIHHAMRNGFTPSTTLKDIGDLVAWWTLKPDAWELDALIRAVTECALGSSLLALWTIVTNRNPAHPIAHGVVRLVAQLPAADQRAARRLVRFFEAQLVNGDIAARTVEVFALPRLTARAVAEVRRRLSARAGRPAAVALGAGADRKSLGQRVAGVAARTWRVTRELADVRHLSAYAAVAREQSRFR